MSAKKTQVFLLTGALVLFVLLFIAPKIAPAAPASESGTAAQATQTLEVYAQLAFKNVAPVQRDKIGKFQSAQQTDSIAAFWDKARRPDLAAYYSEMTAKKVNRADNWHKAGSRYYNAIQFCNDKTEIPVLYQCAIRCLGKALELQPDNTDARITLASCYVEGTPDPMKGISSLKEIEKTDSNNIQLQLAFAFFSVKSGQYNKAEMRFRKVLEIDSSYIAAWLHLADVYEQAGDVNATVKMLEQYAARTSDITARIEINKYIEQLKNKN
jgi:thioredoxin-like negative regulator of GroEL